MGCPFAAAMPLILFKQMLMCIRACMRNKKWLHLKKKKERKKKSSNIVHILVKCLLF